MECYGLVILSNTCKTYVCDSMKVVNMIYSKLILHVFNLNIPSNAGSEAFIRTNVGFLMYAVKCWARTSG